MAGLLFAFLVVLPGVLLLFYCYRIKTSYYHKWLSQREKNKNNKYCVMIVCMSVCVRACVSPENTLDTLYYRTERKAWDYISCTEHQWIIEDYCLLSLIYCLIIGRLTHVAQEVKRVIHYAPGWWFDPRLLLHTRQSCLTHCLDCQASTLQCLYEWVNERPIVCFDRSG